MCTVLLCSHTKRSRALFQINMHFKTSFYLFSLLVTISHIDAWTLEQGIESIKKMVITAYKGYDITNDENCDSVCRKRFCQMATTGGDRLFQVADMVQGEFKKELLEIGTSLYIYGVKCTDKYKDNKQLYMGIGTMQDSVAVYEKANGGTAVLVGIMTHIEIY